MNENAVAGALGLAQKAGRLASGDLAVRENLKKGKAVLLLVAEDTSDNTRKELLHLAEKAGVPVVTALTRERLGAAMGKAPRASVAILDEGFAGLIRSKLS